MGLRLARGPPLSPTQSQVSKWISDPAQQKHSTFDGSSQIQGDQFWQCRGSDPLQVPKSHYSLGTGIFEFFSEEGQTINTVCFTD